VGGASEERSDSGRKERSDSEAREAAGGCDWVGHGRREPGRQPVAAIGG